MTKEQKAMDSITVELLDSLTYGDTIELINGYYLYHYEEDDFIAFNNKKDEEIYCILYSNEGITFSKL